jgi:hypothetical protein
MAGQATAAELPQLVAGISAECVHPSSKESF